jgi:hypothetical protein
MRDSESAPVSLEQCWQRWSLEREQRETLADIEAAVEELRQGRGMSLQAAGELIRERLLATEHKRPA